MSDITREHLRKEINAILKDADLTEMSAKKVRQQLEEKLSCDLSARKKEVDELVMDFVNPKDKKDDDDNDDDDDDDDDGSDDEEGSEEDDDDDSDDEPKKKGKRSAPPKKTSAKKRKSGSSDESSESENESDEEYSPRKGGAKGGKSNAKAGRKKRGSDSDSDEDWQKPKKAATKKTGGTKGRGTGFTRAYTLSPELAALMGTDSLPRHEVVKKMWAMIKERNLYDPKNKQYAICDSELLKVMGVKRFRTFGMLKYLRSHFID